MKCSAWPLLAIAAALSGCGSGGTLAPPDSGARDPGRESIDAGTPVVDAGRPRLLDGGSDLAIDAGPTDAGPADAGPTDAGPYGTDMNDAGTSVSPDSGPAPVALPLLGCPQEGYTVAFTIGAQSFQLAVDTGSAELAVASGACTNCAGVSPLYDPGAGAIDQGTRTSVSYVSGTGWTGEIYEDTVGLAGYSRSTRMDLVAITSQSGGFFDFGGCNFGDVPYSEQGIAGFGPASLAASGTNEVVAALAAAGMPPVFAVGLCSLGGGSLWMGGYAPTSVSAPPVYTPLLSANYYEVTLSDMQVSGASLGFGAGDFGPVVVDTDTTEFEMPADAFDALTTAIAATPLFQQSFGDASWFSGGGCDVPSQSTPPTPAELDAMLPSVTLQFASADGGTVPVVLRPTESYLEPVVSQGVTYYCPEIEARELGGSTVFGSAVMRGLVVIFDTTGKIGFAPQASCP